MITRKSKNLIAIIVIAVLALTGFVSAAAVLWGHHDHSHGDATGGGATSMANITVEDSNGKVATPSANGTAIGTAQELRKFISDTDGGSGYLTNDINDFEWAKLSDNEVGMSSYTLKKGRVLDGNGHKVTAKISSGVNGVFPTISGASAARLDDYSLRKFDGNTHGLTIYASSFLFAVNQGEIKNLRMDIDTSALGSNQTLQWVLLGKIDREDGTRNANSYPLTFGFVTGANFGTIKNCNVTLKNDFRIQSLGNEHLVRYGKEDRNHMEMGFYAGVNSGEISSCTANINATVKMLQRSSNNYGIINSGSANARAVFGAIAGRMQSAPNYSGNQVNMAKAAVYNCIVTGSGGIDLNAEQSGVKPDIGIAFVHAGVVVGANAPYPGTVIDANLGLGTGFVDGIISTYRGNIVKSTSGVRPSESWRALIDCGKISNFTFLDDYDGDTDNCACGNNGGTEHVCAKPNGVKVDGAGDVKVAFAPASSSATYVYIITPTEQDGVIFSVNKQNKSLRDAKNVVYEDKARVFDYQSENYYTNYAEDNAMTYKKTSVSVSETRTEIDTSMYTMEIAFGKQVKVEYKTSSIGKYPSHDNGLNEEIDTFPYDGANKSTVKVSYLTDGDNDTLVEDTTSYQFSSKYRSENQAPNEAIDYAQDLIYPGIYTDIFVRSTLSANHSFVDEYNRYVAPLGKDASGNLVKHKLKINPAYMNAVDEDVNINKGGAGEDNKDVSPEKLKSETRQRYAFDFSVFTRGVRGNRIELQKSTTGSGNNAVTIYPYDRIEYSNDGYTYNTAITYEEMASGKTYDIDKSTDPINGKTFYFRAVKDVKRENGTILMTTVVTLESENYTLIIDGVPPAITAIITSDDGKGMNYNNWDKKGQWKTESFSLRFDIAEASKEGIYLYKKDLGESDSSATKELIDPATMSSNGSYSFNSARAIVFYAVDKYGNRSKDYVVDSKVDSAELLFNTRGFNKDSDTAWGNLVIDGVQNSSTNIIANSVVSDHGIKIKVETQNTIASGVTVYYSVNNGEFVKADGNTIIFDRTANPNYYTENGRDESVFDSVVIKVVTGAGREKTNAGFQLQINKNLVLVDKDLIDTSDGAWPTVGIREEHLTKTYTGNTLLSPSLVNLINKGLAKKLLEVYGETRAPGKELYVEGRYTTSAVGKNNPIILKVIDPQDEYTVDLSRMELVGAISHAQIQVIVSNVTREYGRRNPNIEYTVTGLLGSDKVDLSSVIKVPDTVDAETPAGTVLKLVVPPIGYKQGNYVINSVKEAEITIVKQRLTEITYDDAYLEMQYNGEEQFVKCTYEAPNGTIKALSASYYMYNGGEYVLMQGAPKEIGKYRAEFTIDDDNYTLDKSRSVIDFEMHKADVNIIMPEGALNTKFNSKQQPLDIKLSNGATPVVVYLNDTGVEFMENEYPQSAGTYTVRVVYNNDNDVDENKGKYYSVRQDFVYTIAKVSMAESGIELINVDKRYNGSTSQVIVKNIPVGTKIPEGLKPGEEEGSYILLEGKDITDSTEKVFTFANPNIIEQSLKAVLKIAPASFDDFGVKIDSLSVVFDNKPHSIGIVNLPEGLDVTFNFMDTNDRIVQAFNYDTKSFAMVEAGKYRIRVRLSNVNFTDKVLDGTLTIEITTVTTAEAQNISVAYNGGEHYALITGIPSDINMISKTKVEIQFSGENQRYSAIPMDEARTIWRTPSKITVGRYGFNVLITNANYGNQAIVVLGTLDIQPTTYAEYGTIVEKIPEYTYDGTQKIAQILDVPTGTKIIDMDTDMEVASYIVATDAGTYKRRIKLVNPNIATSGNIFTLELIINAKTNDTNYTFNGFTQKYAEGGVEWKFDKAQLATGFTIEFDALDGVIIKDNVLTFMNAGKYKIVARVMAKNHKTVELSCEVIIEKAIAPYSETLVCEDQTVVFDGKEQRPLIQGLDNQDATIVYTYEGALIGGRAPVNAGTYNMTITIKHANYEDVVVNSILTISPAQLEINGFYIGNSAVNYDGKEHSVQVYDAKGNVLTGYKIELVYGDLGVGVVPVNAGKYTVTGVLNKSNYAPYTFDVPGELVIMKVASQAITAEDVKATYNGKAQKVVVKYADGSYVDENSYTITAYRDGLLMKNGIIDSGEYDCRIIVAQTNYIDQMADIKVKIAPKKVSIQYENTETPIVDSKFVLKGTFKDALGETREVQFEFPQEFINGVAGKYIISAKLDDANYILAEETATIEVSIVANNVPIIIGGAGGGAAVVGGVAVALVVILKKKKISL